MKLENQCHNCEQKLTLPGSASKMFHTCTKMRSIMIRTGKKTTRRRIPEFGVAGPHILIQEGETALALAG